MNCETHTRGPARFRAIGLASIFLMLPGCTSVPPRSPPVSSPAFGVRVLNASVSEVKETSNSVSDAEVSQAQAALRDASTWGAEHYEPQMYAKAQAVLDAALAVRESDPTRCRSLLAEAREAANAAKEAALKAYEDDVRTRFEASRSKLVDIGADRAFPDEFARLVSGIDATADLFATGSYWNARFKAYSTLKGMSDLYDNVRGLLNWLRDARVRVENALVAAQAIDAPRWAPTEMKDAQQKYRDALSQMQAGDLKAAIDSMKTAGQIALRLPYLQNKMDKREASVPPASRQALQDPPVAFQAPPVESRVPSQRVRIANMSMSLLGAPQRLYNVFSAAVARFDLVAAEGLRDAGVMEKVLSGMDVDAGWEAAVSRSGYFGFIYNDRIQMVKDLGTYLGKGEFLHTPYGAQFRLVGTRFSVNLVLCHVEASKDRKLKAAEIAGLADVYRYYENLTGNRGITLVLSGGLSDISEQTSESLLSEREMVSLHTSLAAKETSRDQGQRMFASVALQSRVEESGFGASAPPHAYVVLRTGK